MVGICHGQIEAFAWTDKRHTVKYLLVGKLVFGCEPHIFLVNSSYHVEWQLSLCSVLLGMLQDV